MNTKFSRGDKVKGNGKVYYVYGTQGDRVTIGANPPEVPAEVADTFEVDSLDLVPAV